MVELVHCNRGPNSGIDKRIGVCLLYKESQTLLFSHILSLSTVFSFSSLVELPDPRSCGCGVCSPSTLKSIGSDRDNLLSNPTDSDPAVDYSHLNGRNAASSGPSAARPTAGAASSPNKPTPKRNAPTHNNTANALNASRPIPTDDADLPIDTIDDTKYDSEEAGSEPNTPPLTSHSAFSNPDK